jgi:protein-tyrosine phosphatase
MAEFVLKDMVEKRGIKEDFHIESRATSTEEIWGGKGNPIYPPAQKELRRNNIGNTAYTNFANKRAKQVTKQDYNDYDYLLCADNMNIRNTLKIVGGDSDRKIQLLLDFAINEKRHGQSIADPWYTGNFGITYNDIVEGCEGLLDFLGY